jgi:hypothetical protein
VNDTGSWEPLVYCDIIHYGPHYNVANQSIPWACNCSPGYQLVAINTCNLSILEKLWVSLWFQIKF